MKRTVRWTKVAIRQFHAAIDYIRQDSVQGAEKVRSTILTKVNQPSNDTMVHRKDPYKKDNDGSFLYFETEKYRIAYQVRESEVIIIRVRHTSREPKPY